MRMLDTQADPSFHYAMIISKVADMVAKHVDETLGTVSIDESSIAEEPHFERQQRT